MSLNNLFDTNSDSDDNEDEDFNPENEVLGDNSGSDSEEEDGTSGSHKRKSNGKQEEEVKNELSAEELKQKTDSLWEEFQKDLPKSNESNDGKDSDKDIPQSEDPLKATERRTITKTYDFAGETVKVTEEVANTSKDIQSEDKESDDSKGGPPKPVKRAGGLSSVLSQLKKPKMSVLQKTSFDWKTFKQNKGIEDELSQHNRSKDTFVDRQAFLQRTDVRQFEIEKQIREKNRSQRQLSKD